MSRSLVDWSVARRCVGFTHNREMQRIEWTAPGPTHRFDLFDPKAIRCFDYAIDPSFEFKNELFIFGAPTHWDFSLISGRPIFL